MADILSILLVSLAASLAGGFILFIISIATDNIKVQNITEKWAMLFLVAFVLIAGILASAFLIAYLMNC